MRDQELGTEAGRSGIERDNDPLVNRPDPRVMRDQDAKINRDEPRGDFAEFEKPRPATEPRGGADMLSMLADIHARLVAVEKRSAETQAIVNTAKERGDVGLDTAHVAHIMQKHFFHDQPDVPDEEKPVARFDPFTGEPIAPVNPPPKFDPTTGQRLQ
jgi:hypothetical protein